MTGTPHIRTIGLTRHYRRGPQTVRALDGVDITIARGEFFGIVGSSGSGKTTLLNLLAGLDHPSGGDLEINGRAISSMSRRERSAYRAHAVGMVFQSFNLLGHYTALQNVESALIFNGTPPSDRRRLATEILQRLGLSDRTDHRPADLSGGEQQRVALARAIVKRPEILFADEPTGNLDQDNANQIASLLTSLNAEGLTVVIVTHNLELARSTAHRIIRMQYGRIAGEGGRP